MSFSVVSDTIRFHLRSAETRVSMVLGVPAPEDTSRLLSRSALQNPELNRYDLECMLRRTGQKREGGAGWAGLLASRRAGCANSNATQA